MQKPTFDPGLTQTYTGTLRRAINKDGTFNVHRRGATWRDVHPYLTLINLPWLQFLASLFLAYLVVNTLFATAYYLLPPVELQGSENVEGMGRFMKDFFFSSHTLTTVGYGNISPRGLEANIVSSLESLTGVLGFAIATGLLYGRVSRPSARFGFSDKMLLTAYQEITSLQFRLVNRRTNDLMDIQARVMLMTVEQRNGTPQRTYRLLKLERDEVMFLPLTWTVVHPIDSESPLFGKDVEELKRLQAELLILIRAYDDTFSQTVVARQSYRYDEIIEGKRFAPAFTVNDEGDMILELPRIGEVA